MSDSIVLEGREYISAKRASELSGYARDYIGQLARKGLIGAQRVGGLWYVSMDSLQSYQKNAEEYQPEPPMRQHSEPDAVVSFDGKDYISASRASKLTGYNQDYIGQLARAGKILSRQIGNRWYVEREGLLAHKSQKDSMLATVQRESVGLTPQQAPQKAQKEAQELYISRSEPFYTYISESEMDLLPGLREAPRQPQQAAAARTPSPIQPAAFPTAYEHPIPVRRVSTDIRVSGNSRQTRYPKKVRTHGKAMRKATQVVVALTFVIVLSYGIVSLRDNSTYTYGGSDSGVLHSTAQRFSAAAVEALDGVGALLEKYLSKELQYKRK